MDAQEDTHSTSLLRNGVPPRNRQGLRTGFTTGACAAAAAKAAAHCLIHNEALTSVCSTLPNRQAVRFGLSRCTWEGEGVLCGVIKDAGDDPDCTHGAELLAHVCLRRESGVEILGGEGVALVTLPGLGLEVGTAAVNPVPRRNITEMVQEELAQSSWSGAVVRISAPAGEAMALKTTNARLGLLGGISILGTSGIVRPYSTAAFRASVVQAIRVAHMQGCEEVVLTTGGRSETWAMRLYPELNVRAFVQMGDFAGVSVRQAAHCGLRRVRVVGMMGKLSKLAAGRMMTHAAGSQVDLQLLAGLAAEEGASLALCEEILKAVTARRVLELCAEARIHSLPTAICRRASAALQIHAGESLALQVSLLDFEGNLLGTASRPARLAHKSSHAKNKRSHP